MDRVTPTREGGSTLGKTVRSPSPLYLVQTFACESSKAFAPTPVFSLRLSELQHQKKSRFAARLLLGELEAENAAIRL